MILAYLNHDVAEQLHQQILTVEAAIGLDVQDEDEDEDGLSSELEGETLEHAEHGEGIKASEKESSAFSPAFAQALKQLNDLARQRLPDASASGGQPAGELSSLETSSDEEDALEQLQDAFVQMMEVVRELAEELSTDALTVTGRLKCARTDIQYIPSYGEDGEDVEGEVMGRESTDVV